jgi:hypothetical protein
MTSNAAASLRNLVANVISALCDHDSGGSQALISLPEAVRFDGIVQGGFFRSSKLLTPERFRAFSPRR